MSKRSLLLFIVLTPLFVLAQEPAKPVVPFNAPTRAVLLANRPVQFTEAEWLRLMERPASQSLYPLRIDQAMLDTLDAKALDPRFRYEMIPAR